jgi:hypothetical protein
MSVGQLALRTLRLALYPYVLALVLGAVTTTLAMLGLAALAGDRPWRADLLGPNWMNLLVELVASTIYGGGSPGLAMVTVAVLVVLPLAWFVQMVGYSFLAGGLLEALLAGRSAGPDFWRACRRWFWPFLRLSLLGLVILGAIAILLAVAAGFARTVLGPDIAAILQFAAQAVVFGWLELARATMVAESGRSVGAALRRAARAALRPVVLLIWLLLALPGSGLLLATIMPPGVADPYSTSGVLQALAFGQVVAFLGAWTKVIRLAVAVRLALMARPASVSPLGGTVRTLPAE